MCVMDELIVLSIVSEGYARRDIENISAGFLSLPKSRETISRTIYPMNNQPQIQNMHPSHPPVYCWQVDDFRCCFSSKNNGRNMGPCLHVVVFRRQKLQEIGILRRWP